MTIEDIRTEIDHLDNELLALFNRRAALALSIGQIKKELGLPIYDPSREKLIFTKMAARNLGPLDNNAIKRIFERLIDESRTLERIKTKEL